MKSKNPISRMPRYEVAHQLSEARADGQKPMTVGVMRCLKTTVKAMLVEGTLRDGHVGELWVPKSVLHADNGVKRKGQKGVLVVKTWWGEINL